MFCLLFACLLLVLAKLVDRVSATIKWIRVPSHTDIPGNERADVLAEEGGKLAPLSCFVFAG